MIFKIKDTDKLLSDRGIGRMGKVQKIVDSEVIRRMEPYIPLDTGYLKNESIKTSTIIGSGEINQKAPYAQRQYYTNDGSKQTGKRGKFWFERMKADQKDDILSAAKREAGVK